MTTVNTQIENPYIAQNYQKLGVQTLGALTSIQKSNETTKSQELHAGDSVIKSLMAQGYSINHLNGLAPSKTGWIA